MNKATLRLFNAIHAQSERGPEATDEITSRTIANGYVLEPGIRPDTSLLDEIESVVGISGVKANSAFHKSWSFVQNTPMEVLVTQQILHYITTYYFQSQGCYREDSVYIPHEQLDVPDIRKDIELYVIKAMDAGQLLSAIIDLGSGIALSEESLDDIMEIVEGIEFDRSFVYQIKNRELKTRLFEFYGLVPDEPVEYLRFVIAKLTGESLLIKNQLLIEKIKDSDALTLDSLLNDAPENLASIFYRFKPLFLALKAASRNKTFFNRLRKKAPELHVPVPVDYLNSVTELIKREQLNLETLKARLEAASLFRKIRLASALDFRLQEGNGIVYRIRSGRGWASEYEWSEKFNAVTSEALDIVKHSLADGLRSDLEGKVVYIPKNIDYALPASEKQFTGHFPSGTSIVAPDDLVVGIHWVNTRRSIDLDLSVIGESGKVGWDAQYRSKDLEVLFSGDVTNAPAPNGATELFYLKGGLSEAMILMLNFYNYASNSEVEAKIIVANEKPKNFNANYVVDPNNIIATSSITVKKKQNILGLIAPVGGQNRVYLAHTSVGGSITASDNKYTKIARDYLVDTVTNGLGLKGLLLQSGAVVHHEKNESRDIDLSPSKINKSTIVNLLSGKW